MESSCRKGVLASWLFLKEEGGRAVIMYIVISTGLLGTHQAEDPGAVGLLLQTSPFLLIPAAGTYFLASAAQCPPAPLCLGSLTCASEPYANRPPPPPTKEVLVCLQERRWTSPFQVQVHSPRRERIHLSNSPSPPEYPGFPWG